MVICVASFCLRQDQRRYAFLCLVNSLRKKWKHGNSVVYKRAGRIVKPGTAQIAMHVGPNNANMHCPAHKGMEFMKDTPLERGGHSDGNEDTVP